MGQAHCGEGGGSEKPGRNKGRLSASGHAGASLGDGGKAEGGGLLEWVSYVRPEDDVP